MGRLIAIGLAVSLLAAVAASGQSAGPIRKRPRVGGAPRPDSPPPPPALEELETVPFIAVHDDPVIVRAMEYAHAFGADLPDFLCNQVTERYSSRNLGKKWKHEDTVEAEVLYVDGRENYRNIRVDGRPLRSFDSLGGTTSTGEYGTILRNLFHPETTGGFKRGAADTIAGHEARIYEVRVDASSSRWRIGVNDQEINSAYRARAWIEEETGRVFRVEMEAIAFPPGFLLASSEITIDYSPVEIGYESRLLPLRSENLACFRQDMLCRRNEITFAGYRKFEAETTIDFGEQ